MTVGHRCEADEGAGEASGVDKRVPDRGHGYSKGPGAGTHLGHSRQSRRVRLESRVRAAGRGQRGHLMNTGHGRDSAFYPE